jgi:hypothetical protein
MDSSVAFLYYVCLACRFYTERLELKLERLVEAIFHVLINLIQNCAKVMATSGLVACRYIIQVSCVFVRSVANVARLFAECAHTKVSPDSHKLHELKVARDSEVRAMFIVVDKRCVQWVFAEHAAISWR